MTSAVLARRIAGHHLADNGLATAVDVVRSLACVQSQEWSHAFWSLGQRTRGLTYPQVQAEFDRGEFVRTHILRPTWHFVAAADLRWIQAVTAPRVQQLNGTMYRREGLAPADLDRAVTTISTELAGGGAGLTRAELGRALGADGIRLVYLIMNAELEGIICSGPLRGAQHTYVLVEDRIPDHHFGDAAELAYRFFAGHGPASVKDLARWSSLTVTQSQDATEDAADRLDSEVVDGSTLYSAEAETAPSTGSGNVWSTGSGKVQPTTRPLSSARPERVEGSKDNTGSRAEPRVLLLPLYDELTLSYPMINFPSAAGHPHPAGVDRFVGLVIIDQVDVGTWRRTVQGRRVVVELKLAPGVTDVQRRAAEDQARRLGDFLGRELELVSS